MNDLSAAVAAAGIVRTRDLKTWERLPNLRTLRSLSSATWCFTNGAIADEDGRVFLYYASSDTRMHVAETTVDRLCDYVFHTPADPLRSPDCVRQRCELIRKNLEYLGK